MHASKFTKFKFIVRDARVFPGSWFDFTYPHNSSIFFATPQIYVAADKNKIYRLRPWASLRLYTALKCLRFSTRYTYPYI